MNKYILIAIAGIAAYMLYTRKPVVAGTSNNPVSTGFTPAQNLNQVIYPDNNVVQGIQQAYQQAVSEQQAAVYEKDTMGTYYNTAIQTLNIVGGSEQSYDKDYNYIRMMESSEN